MEPAVRFGAKLIAVTGLMRSGTSPLAMFLHQMGVSMGTYQRFPTQNEWAHFEWEDASLADPLCSILMHPSDRDDPRRFIDSYVRRRARDANGKPWGVKTPFLLPFLDELREVCAEINEDLEIALTEREYGETIKSLRRQSSHLSEFERGGLMPTVFSIQEKLRDCWEAASEGSYLFHVDDTIKYPRMAAERLAKLAGVETDLDMAIRGFRGRGL